MNRPSRPWHACAIDEALQALDADAHGLSLVEAERRLARYGPNRLPEQGRRSPLRRFLEQFNNVLIYVLIAAAVVTALLQQWVDTAVILGVVVINGIIGFIQEGKAEKALEAIAKMLSPQAVVTRDGQRETIPADQLVPGDIVLLGSGDRVPADMRIVRARGLQVQEAALTGESVAADKDSQPVDLDAALGDRTSMAYSGTLVTSGRASGVVVETGANTQIGQISTMMAEVQKITTPLLQQMAIFGRWLTAAILILAAAAFAFGVWIRGFETTEMFMAAVGIAVAAIPEGLPAIMTITLAIGVSAMAQRNAIIRRLPAVETLGAVTTICSDKTGTLTRNELAVQRVATGNGTFDVTGIGYKPEGTFGRGGETVNPGDEATLMAAIIGGICCNDAELRQNGESWTLHGSPVDGALLTLGLKAGRRAGEMNQRYPRRDAIPFESEHKYMATLHDTPDGESRIIYLKGAPERVLELCSKVGTLDDGESIDHARWSEQIRKLAGEGFRTLAVAARAAGPQHDRLDFDDIEVGGFTLLALFGLIDPSREEAVSAVAACQSAGIRVKMITGDHAATARAVARQIGILHEGGALTGRELDQLSEEELKQKAGEVDVYARSTPEHKLRLVKALQARKEVVAMTGDGVNDAPALKRADVGIAMGERGTEAAKEAAEMVLADDNFATIANAVRAGRTVYDNLRKAILFILPTNGGQAFTVMTAIIIGTMMPITPVQILWVNMVMAVTLALSLAFEQAEPNIMERPPRPRDEPILSGVLFWRIVFVSALLVIATFGLFMRARAEGTDIETARTIAVNTLVAGQIVYLFNSRVIDGPAWSPHALRSAGPAIVSISVLVVLQGLFIYLPEMQFLFGTAPVGLEDWAWIAASAAAIFVIVEVEKATMRRLRRG